LILVSACLLGVNCKYNQGNNLNKKVLELCWAEQCIPVCPEQLGGLSTPRIPAEIIGGDGGDVLAGRAKIIDKNGQDVTAFFLKGAREVEKIVNLFSIERAILKERSPSCGVNHIYAGDFRGRLIPGSGVTTALLRRLNLNLMSEEDFVQC
jgi:uncharacterized protein YbbK (DUF523 family)